MKPCVKSILLVLVLLLLVRNREPSKLSCLIMHLKLFKETHGFFQFELIQRIPNETLNTVKRLLREFGSGVLTNSTVVIESLGYKDALTLLKSNVLDGNTLIVGEFENTENISPKSLGERIIALIKKVLNLHPELMRELTATVKDGKIIKISTL